MLLSFIMHTVTLAEAQARLPELIAETQRGEEVIITSDEKPVAKLAAPPPAPDQAAASTRWRGFGLLKGRIKIAPDFDEPLEDFREYMQ